MTPPEAEPPTPISRWRCATCGQQCFTSADCPPPTLCEQCRTVTPWQLLVPQSPPTLLRWRCLNCGQQTFTAPDETPPDTCAYCMDMTTWGKITV